MKWKRSKKAQQEAKAKAAEERKAKRNCTSIVDSGSEYKQMNNNSSPHPMLSKMDTPRQNETDEELDDNDIDDNDDIPIGSDQEDEDIDVGMSEPNPHLSALVSKSAAFTIPPCSAPLPLATQPLPLVGPHSSIPPNSVGSLPPPPSLLLRGTPSNNYGMSPNTLLSEAMEPHHTTLGSLLTPAHLARLSGSNRLYRPFVA